MTYHEYTLYLYGPPRGYGEQGNLSFLLMGTGELEQIFQGNLGKRWILVSNVEFLLGEQSKNTFENKGDFGNFSREHGNTDPLGGFVYTIQYILLKMIKEKAIQTNRTDL